MEPHRVPPAVPGSAVDERRIPAVQDIEEVYQSFTTVIPAGIAGIQSQGRDHGLACPAGRWIPAGLAAGTDIHGCARLPPGPPWLWIPAVPAGMTGGDSWASCSKNLPLKEQTRDVVVSDLQPRVVPAQDVVEPASGVIRGLAEIKPQQRGGVIRVVHVGHLQLQRVPDPPGYLHRILSSVTGWPVSIPGTSRPERRTESRILISYSRPFR